MIETEKEHGTSRAGGREEELTNLCGEQGPLPAWCDGANDTDQAPAVRQTRAPAVLELAQPHAVAEWAAALGLQKLRQGLGPRGPLQCSGWHTREDLARPVSYNSGFVWLLLGLGAVWALSADCLGEGETHCRCEAGPRFSKLL